MSFKTTHCLAQGTDHEETDKLSQERESQSRLRETIKLIWASSRQRTPTRFTGLHFCAAPVGKKGRGGWSPACHTQPLHTPPAPKEGFLLWSLTESGLFLSQIQMKSKICAKKCRHASCFSPSRRYSHSLHAFLMPLPFPSSLFMASQCFPEEYGWITY